MEMESGKVVENWDWNDAKIDADLFMLDPVATNIGQIPEDLVGNCILGNKGDYCISQTPTMTWRFSILDEDFQPHHLVFESTGSGWTVRGLIYGAAPTIGEVLYNLRDPTIDYLSGLLGVTIRFRKQITLATAATNRFIRGDVVTKKNILRKDDLYEHYSADVTYNGESIEANLMTTRGTTDIDWKTKMFDELRVAILAEKMRLPIHSPVAVLLADQGYLVYKKTPGAALNVYLTQNLAQMDYAARIRLCFGLSRVMAELHMAKMYHGAPSTQHFFVRYSQGQYNRVRLRFNGSNGLVPENRAKPVTLEDFSRMAPEICETRFLSPQSGVYGLALVLEQVLNDAPLPNTTDPNRLLVSSVNVVIQRCKVRDPALRMTMNGAFIALRDIVNRIVDKNEPKFVFL